MDPTISSLKGLPMKMIVDWVMAIWLSNLGIPHLCQVWTLENYIEYYSASRFHAGINWLRAQSKPQEITVAAAMMLLAHISHSNSYTVAPDHRRRTPWARPASAAGSWDHGVVWLSRQWRRMPWFAVVCHGLPSVRYYACDRVRYNFIGLQLR